MDNLWYLNLIKKIVYEQKMDDRVRWFIRASFEKVKKEFDESKTILSLKPREHFGMVFVEGMST